MKVELRAGAKLDVLSPDEAERLLKELEKRARSREPVRVRGMEAGKTDATGALTLPLYNVRVGAVFTLHRLLVQADGSSPATPFTAAGLEVLLQRGGELLAFADPAQLPTALVDDGYHQAHAYRNGEAVELVIVAGPASTRIVAGFAGFLHQGAP